MLLKMHICNLFWSFSLVTMFLKAEFMKNILKRKALYLMVDGKTRLHLTVV